MAIIHGAEPFLLPGCERGVLLVHGFTGSPSEMRLLGEFLNEKGFTVLGPRLCGHGTSVEEMSTTRWHHWYSAVEDGYHLLKGICSEVYAAGLSMGGLFALKLAVEYPIAKVVSLSAPIRIADKRLALLPLYRLFREYEPKKRRKLDVDPEYCVAYDATPLSGVDSLLKLIRHVDRLLPLVKAPALVVQSRAEHTVRPESAEYIYRRIGSRDKKLVWLEKSGHIITVDVERETVFNNILSFLNGEERHGRG